MNSNSISNLSAPVPVSSSYQQNQVNQVNLVNQVNNQLLIQNLNEHDEDYMKIIKSNSIIIQCPECRYRSNTTTSSTLNLLNFTFCLFCSFFVWVPFQLINNKDLNCCDVKHTCSNCGFCYGKYYAC